jgi:hypothetical protein
LTISQSAVETLLFRARRTLASKLNRVPERVAVALNAPVLIRLLRRLIPNAGAIKTTAAVVAIGAVSTAGGRELVRSLGPPAPVQTPVVAHAPTGVPVAPISSRRVSTAPASPWRTPRPVRHAAPSTAEAAVPTHTESPPTSPAASAPNSAPPAAVPAATVPAAVAPIPAQISLPAAPALPVELPATAGELSGSATTGANAVVQAVTAPLPVPPVSIPDPPKLLPSP